MQRFWVSLGTAAWRQNLGGKFFQKAGGRRQKAEGFCEPTLKNVGLKQGRRIPERCASRNTYSFLVGFIPTTQVFIDTPNLLHKSPRPSAFLCKRGQSLLFHYAYPT